MSKSKKNSLQPGDGRSLRLSRLPAEMRLLMRAFPRDPRHDATLGAVDSIPLAELISHLAEFHRIASGVLDDPVGVAVETHCYAAFANMLAGEQSNALLYPGVYLIHEVASPNRLLYIGSGTETAVRHRIINHLCYDSNKRGLIEIIRATLTEIMAQRGQHATLEDLENRLRLAAFSRNRWTLTREVAACTPDILQAIRAIETGAFDLTILRLGESQRALAALLEAFLLRASQRPARPLPPLNAIDKRDLTRFLTSKPRGQIPPADALRLQAALFPEPSQETCAVPGPESR